MKNLSSKILLVNFLCILLQSETVKIADVAQLAEHLICNQAAVGSSPSIGSIEGAGTRGEALETKRNLVSKQGKLPEWPNGADCKSAGFYLRWFESITSHL